jgi:hypothetical protein
MSALVPAAAQILPDKAATARREMRRQSKFLVPVEGTIPLSRPVQLGPEKGLKSKENRTSRLS